MSIYQNEEYRIIVIAENEKAFEYGGGLFWLGLKRSENLLFDSFGNVDDEFDLDDKEGFYAENMAVEDIAPIIQFCSDKPLKPIMLDKDFKKIDVTALMGKIPTDQQEITLKKSNGDKIRLGWVVPSKGLFRRQLKKSTSYYKKHSGWTIHTGFLNSLIEKGIRRIRYYDTEEKQEYHTFTNTFKQFGIEINQDQGLDQLCLPEYHWFKSCYDCPIYSISKGPQVPECGPSDADIMFVGEAPWVDELEEGKPFVGKAGQLLTKMLEDVGIDRNRCYISNTVKCVPPEIDGSKKPGIIVISCCITRLYNEVVSVKPRIIIPLGRTACDTVFSKARDRTMTELQSGKKYWIDNGDGPIKDLIVFPLFHPSYILYNKEYEPGSPKYENRMRLRYLKELCDEKGIDTGDI